MVTKTYLPCNLCDSCDNSDTSDTSDSCDSSDSSDSKGKSCRKGNTKRKYTSRRDTFNKIAVIF